MLGMQSKQLEAEPELIQSLYGALTEPDGFHCFLEKLAKSICGKAAELVVLRRDPLRIDHIWYYGLSDEFLNWYLDNDMVSIDVVIKHAVQQMPGLFQSANSLVVDAQFDPSLTKWLGEQGVVDAAYFVVESSASHSVILTIQRAVEHGIFQPHEIAVLNRLVPYIRQAVLLNRQMELRSEAASSLSAVIDVLPDATVILDSYSTVLHSNRAARALLERERSLAIRDERLSFSESDIQSAFFFSLDTGCARQCWP